MAEALALRLDTTDDNEAMMTNKDLEMVAGSSWLINIAIKELLPTVPGSNFSLILPLNLADATEIEFCVKKTSAHASPKMLFKRLGNGVSKVNNGTNGVITVDLAPIDTVKMAPGTYEYDLWIVLNNSRVPALQGKFKIIGAVNTDV